MLTTEELSKLVDTYHEQREVRLANNRVTEALKEEEDASKALLLGELREQEASAIGGSEYIAERVVQNEPSMENWDDFYAHVQATGEFDLLNRALNGRAVKERWALDEEVPGVGSFPVEKLSLRKKQGI